MIFQNYVCLFSDRHSISADRFIDSDFPFHWKQNGDESFYIVFALEKEKLFLRPIFTQIEVPIENLI